MLKTRDKTITTKEHKLNKHQGFKNIQIYILSVHGNSASSIA
jgi:hypothetical protein